MRYDTEAAGLKRDTTDIIHRRAVHLDSQLLPQHDRSRYPAMRGTAGADLRVCLLERRAQDRRILVLVQRVPSLVALIHIVAVIALGQLMECLEPVLAERETAGGVAPCLVICRTAGTYLLTAVDNRRGLTELTGGVLLHDCCLLHRLVLLQYCYQRAQVCLALPENNHRHRSVLVVVCPRHSENT